MDELVYEVGASKQYFLSSLGRTQNKCAVVLVFPVAGEVNQFGEIGLREVGSGHFVECFEARILHEVGHLYGHLVACGHGIIVHVAFYVFVSILEIDVVRRHIISVEPKV